MAVEVSCATDQKPIGVSSCDKIMEYPKTFMFTPTNLSVTLANAATSSTWQTPIKADKGSRIVLFPLAHMVENASTDAAYDSTVLSEYKADDGKYIFDFLFKANMTQHKAIKSYDKASGRVFLVDRNNQAQGFSTDDTNLKGMSAKIFVEKLRVNDGALVTATRVKVVLLDSNEIDDNGRLIDMSSFFSGLIPLSPAEITVEGSPSATSIIVKVVNANDGTAITGLVLADFELDDANAGTLDSLVDNGDGTYTITATGAETGTINLVAASALTIDAYESTGAATLTI